MQVIPHRVHITKKRPCRPDKGFDCFHHNADQILERVDQPRRDITEVGSLDIDREANLFKVIENVIDFQGTDYKKSYIPQSAQKLLKRWDKTAGQYAAIEKRNLRP